MPSEICAILRGLPIEVDSVAWARGGTIAVKHERQLKYACTRWTYKEIWRPRLNATCFLKRARRFVWKRADHRESSLLVQGGMSTRHHAIDHSRRRGSQSRAWFTFSSKEAEADGPSGMRFSLSARAFNEFSSVHWPRAAARTDDLLSEVGTPPSSISTKTSSCTRAHPSSSTA